MRELENILERALTLSEDAVIREDNLQLPAERAPATSAGGASSGRPPDQPLEDYLSEIEKEEILKALEETRWNRTAAAGRLGMTFRSLRYRLKKLQLDETSPE